MVFRYYRGTHGVIVVYDVSNGESFANVKRWLQEIDTNCEVVNKILGKGKNSTFIQLINFHKFNVLVGNKNDDPQRKVVITEDAQRFANQMEIQLFETSAKENLNVEDMFLAITEQVLRHKKQTQKHEESKLIAEKIRLGQPKNKIKKKCC